MAPAEERVYFHLWPVGSTTPFWWGGRQWIKHRLNQAKPLQLLPEEKPETEEFIPSHDVVYFADPTPDESEAVVEDSEEVAAMKKLIATKA
jgi:hypothetical protein